jgi:hypothetical protein
MFDGVLETCPDTDEPAASAFGECEREPRTRSDEIYVLVRDEIRARLGVPGCVDARFWLCGCRRGWIDDNVHLDEAQLTLDVREPLAFASSANRSHDFMPAQQQLARDVTPHEPCCAGDKDSHVAR